MNSRILTRACETSRRALSAASLLAVLALAATMLVSVPATAVAAIGDPTVAAPVVVLDTDMDFDDAAALAYLAEADKLGLIDLRAVTVEASGIAFPGSGLSHARCLLDKLGLPGIPVSDGDLTRPNNFPDWGRALLDGIVESGVRSDPATPCPILPSEGHAVALLDSSIRSTPGEVTLITTGPLTNVAEALAQNPALTGKIGRVFLEGGTLDWSTFGTQFFDAHDYNLWVDAPAAQAVLDAVQGRVFMTGAGATQYVPLTEAFRQQLAADTTTAAADTVLTMISHPLLVAAEAENQGGAFWWDPLDAVAATKGGIVQYDPTRISIVQSGVYEGAAFVDPTGPLVHYGIYADRSRFHEIFLEVLNGRPPST
jgi:purine nucleosidase